MEEIDPGQLLPQTGRGGLRWRLVDGQGHHFGLIRHLWSLSVFSRSIPRIKPRLGTEKSIFFSVRSEHVRKVRSSGCSFGAALYPSSEKVNRCCLKQQELSAPCLRLDFFEVHKKIVQPQLADST